MPENRRRGLRRSPLARVAGALPVILVCAFLLLPLVVVAVSSFTSASNFRFPPQGFSLRWYEEVFTSPDWLGTVGTSLILAVVVAPIAVVIGTLGGYAIGAGRFPGQRALNVLFLSPLAVPGIMVGLALMYQFQSLGLRGSAVGIVIAHLIVVFPFCVRVAAVSAASLDRRLVHAARVLGASRFRAFLTITVPQLVPGVVAGAFLAAVISLGEVAVSVFVAGSDTTTVPVQIYSAVQVQLEPSVAAVSTLLLVVSVATIAILDRTVHISRFL
ncbi:ABC transporter permease [Microbacterium indicum]|uniref:ABC transporter permease n=1 Tax=Microbacterium indicum TaxID=358100 RepID=UPI0003F67A47|nr:ABC transporter permease [Microbacterium indicum]